MANKKVFLLTTETSGDLLGGRLLHELKTFVPNLEVLGVGGDLLIKEGMTPSFHIRDFNVMGLFEVLSQLKRLKRIFNSLRCIVEQEKPDLIVLIDAPDFNLRFAKAVKGSGIPIVYYVSPQVWAWRKKRAKLIAELVDHIMLLFSFETEIYDSLGLASTWVGHPLVDELTQVGSRESFLEKHKFLHDRPLIALAPGSRPSEVARLLPVMLETAAARIDRYQFVLPLAPVLDRETVETQIGGLPIHLLSGQMREIMHHADAAVVASGTATLETALLKTPMIVGYKLKTSTYLVAKRLVKVPHIALVNLVLGKRVVPELIQNEFCAARVLPLLDQLVGDSAARTSMIAEFQRLEPILGGGGASRRAATVIKDYLL